jgi:hypothetical protein
MCIALAKPENTRVLDSVLEQCFKSNPDGAGFVYLDNDELVTQKGFFTFDSFMEAYQPHENKQALIHFRIKTHGALNEENCHPFTVNEDISFIHNGIIQAVPNHADKSDTIIFNETVLQPLVTKYGDSILADPVIQTLLKDYIGYSKLAFINKKTKEFSFINKQMGNVTDGIWFSNLSWQPYVAPVYKQQPYDKRNTPVPYKKPVKKTVLSVVKNLMKGGIAYVLGDLVSLTWAHQNKQNVLFPVGTVCEIETCYSDNTVDLYSFKEKTLILDVPLYQVALSMEQDLVYSM